MINIDLGLGDLTEEFKLDKNQVKGLISYSIEEVTAQFARQWDIEAKNTLKKTREIYRSAISVEKIDEFTSRVYLNPASWLANAIESGMDSYDMKKGFMKSSKVKHTKKGKPYLTIPFRFGISQAQGDSNTFAGVMPAAIHKAVKSHSKSNPNSKAGLPLSKIPTQYQIPVSSTLRKEMKNPNFESIPKGTAMTSIYQGLQKRGGGGYVMFRRVSLNTALDKWIHPGFEEKNLAGQALKNIDIPQIVDVSIDNYLVSLGFSS